MPNVDDIRWFKQKFSEDIEAGVKGTAFSLDMLTAFACQESGEIWPQLRKKSVTLQQILALCVGDTLDADKGRKAFPATKAELLSKPGGAEMFKLAHDALVAMAEFIPGYRGVAANPNKFCHGFGIFQYDLQHFLGNSDFFLQQKYKDFNACLQKCIGELHAAMQRIGYQNKTTLSDYEMAYVAIAYNTGGFKPNLGLKQGYYDGRQYYGESFFNYLRLAQTVVWQARKLIQVGAPAAGKAIIAPPSPVKATGPIFQVDTRAAALVLRRDPRVPRKDGNSNVVTWLPDGHLVQAVAKGGNGRFLEVETSLLGAHHRGFAPAKLLKGVRNISEVPVIDPALTTSATGIIAAYMPRKPGTITKRSQPANAHSLNESHQPRRTGNTAEELRRDLAGILGWLAVDDVTHLRYQRHAGHTFCNIYAHDYCHLAGAYLPRVWWTAIAIAAMLQGQTVEPLLDKTIDEQQANDLFRWLRDFGPLFGWRRTGDLTKLQLEVNQGALGLIVARRVTDGLSGHIVLVIPETEEHRARRAADGAVIAPLQSQAGLTNFQFGIGKRNWWMGEQFAESAFWLHA